MKCLNCGKSLVIKAKRDLNRKKFCSRQCLGIYIGKRRYRESPEYFEKLSEIGNRPEYRHKKGSRGKNHPQWKGGLILKKCHWCDSEFKTTRWKIKCGYGKYCSRNCFLQWQSSGAKIGTNIKTRHVVICKLCGTERLVPPCLSKTAKYCSARCHNIGNHVFAKKFRRTSIEIKLEDIIKSLGIEFKSHKNIGKLTIPDVFVNPNVAIYADGDYWHSLPDVIVRDNKINAELKERGYIVMRFSENDINKRPDIVKQKLKEVCHSFCQ